MPLRPTSSEQVDGHRFVVQRARNAAVGADISERADRLRTHARAAWGGVAFGAVLLAGAGVLAFVRPAPDLTGVAAVQVKESGALLVSVEGTWHPVPNLASARLILGQPVEPERVPGRAVEGTRRGPNLGMLGAPALLPSHGGQSTWMVCDAEIAETGGLATSVVALEGGAPESWPRDAAALVSDSGQGWLVADGRRSRVDLGDSSLLDVLGLSGFPRRVMSAAALELLPENPPLERISVPRAGEPAPLGPSGMRIGEVFDMPAASGSEYYVVLSEGVQRLGAVAADLLWATGPSAASPVLRTLAPSQVGAPVVDVLALDHLPVARPRQAPAAKPLTCTWWSGGEDGIARSGGVVSAGSIAEVAATPLTYPSSADGPGLRVDAVSLPAGGIVAWRAGSSGVAGEESAVVITDGGVVHDVPDAESFAALGLPEASGTIPSRLADRLPSGPALRSEAARVAFDSVEPALADPKALESPG